MPAASRWGCLRALPTGDRCEALVSFGADQWVRLPMSADDAARQGLRAGQCVAVDTGAMPMRVTAVRV